FTLPHALSLSAAHLGAVETVYAKRVLKELPGTVVAFGRMAFGSAFIFLFLLMTGKASAVGSMTPAQYGWIGVTSLLLLVYVLTFYNGLKLIPATTATSILALGSPVTTMLVWVFQGTAIPTLQLAGILLIIGGVAAVCWAPRRLSETAAGA
ncbi:MAG: DMT family transporter, partial [Nanoarchaeota archaeon]|nr:DMT family transporter [Nanoarchaeota archaeon]